MSVAQGVAVKPVSEHPPRLSVNLQICQIIDYIYYDSEFAETFSELYCLFTTYRVFSKITAVPNERCALRGTSLAISFMTMLRQYHQHQETWLEDDRGAFGRNQYSSPRWLISFVQLHFQVSERVTNFRRSMLLRRFHSRL